MYDSDELRALAEGALKAESGSSASKLRQATPPETVLALLDEIERLRKDAERYRWIKSKKEDFDNMAGASCHATKLSNILKRRDDWDAAIDAAMTQGGDA